MKRKPPEYHAYVYVYSTLCKNLDVHKLEPRRSWPCRDADSLCPPPCAQASRLVVGGDTGRNGPRARVREWLAWHSMASHAPNISRRSGSNYFIIADHGSWCERLASSAPLQGKTPRNLSSILHQTLGRPACRLGAYFSRPATGQLHPAVGGCSLCNARIC